jgi:PAS domain S-box-containing protein
MALQSVPHVTTFETLLQSAAESILIADEKGRIIWANEKAQGLFGYNRSEMLGRKVEMLLPERLREAHVRHRGGYVTNPRNRPMGAGLDLVARRKDGSEFPVEVSLSHAGEGQDLLVMATVADITSRRTMEEALAESEVRYRSLIDALLDSSASGIVIRDADFGVLWVNRVIEEFFGIRRAEAVGDDLRNLLREHAGPKIENPEAFLHRVAAGSCGEPGEDFEIHVLPAENRQERWLEYRSEPILSGLFAGGRIDHYYDGTELKQAEQAKLQLMEERIRELEADLQALERVARPPKAAVTAHVMGVVPLRESADLFAELIKEYGKVMDQALERRIYKTDHSLAEPLADLAGRLGFLKATPRDVVELHREALQQKSRNVPPSKMRGYLEEGHLLLVELLGDLAAWYRNQAFHGRAPEHQRQP